MAWIAFTVICACLSTIVSQALYPTVAGSLLFASLSTLISSLPFWVLLCIVCIVCSFVLPHSIFSLLVLYVCASFFLPTPSLSLVLMHLGPPFCSFHFSGSGIPEIKVVLNGQHSAESFLSFRSFAAKIIGLIFSQGNTNKIDRDIVQKSRQRD